MRRHRYTNRTGTISIKDSGWGGAYKSQLECDCFIRTTFESGVRIIRLQEPRIRYSDAAGISHRYTGDLFVSFTPESGRKPQVIECKYKRDLKDVELETMLNCVARSVAALGYEFVIRTEEHVYTSEYPMKEFVFGYGNLSRVESDADIMDLVRTKGELSLGELIQAARPGRIEQLELIPQVWRLVARGHLTTDFEKILDQTAKIRIPSV